MAKERTAEEKAAQAERMRAARAQKKAEADAQAELVQALQQQMEQHKADLADAKKEAEAAAALEADLREQVSIIQSQIAVLKSEIAAVQNDIGEKEQEIEAKTAEIALQEENIAVQWEDFKTHMAAMQELREGGTVAMLSAVTDLYQLLTFSEVMQDISVRDTEILNEMRDAKAALDRGWLLSFTGNITCANARRAPEVIRCAPMDRIMLETDAPYMAPVPHRGERCDSSLIPLTAAAIAQLKGLTVEEVLAITLENGKRFFDIT